MSTTNKNKYKLLERLKSLSSSINQYEDLWDQWILIDSISTNDEMDLKYYSILDNWCSHNFNKGKQHNSCLCSKHPIVNLNLMKNFYTNEKCIIGCCCIKKFGSNDLKTDMKVNQGEKQGNRYCQICKRKLPNKFPAWQIYHKQCYNKN